MGGNSLTVKGLDRLSRQLLAAPLDGARLNNLAHGLWLGDDPVSALAWARWATHPLAWTGQSIDGRAWRTLANILLDHGRYREAEEVFRCLDPEQQDPQVQVGLSLALEGQDHWLAAASHAEARFCLQRPPTGMVNGSQWMDWPSVDRLSIWDEQGFGDSIQFSRWLPRLLSDGTTVSFFVRPALVRLFQEGLSWLGSDLSVVDRTSHSIAGCHGSVLSLPWLLSRGSCAAPALPIKPWLRLGQPQEQQRQQPRVGLVWSAGQYSQTPLLVRESAKKSLTQRALQSLCDAIHAAGCEPVSLQFGAERTKVEALSPPCQQGLTPAADFYELALAMQRCDLLISVDTAAAHLAGALGQPCWLLLPWAAAPRWGRSQTVSALYPTFRLFRQAKPRDWMAAIDAIGSALQAWATS